MGKIKPTTNFSSLFWEYNYPVQLLRDDDTGDVSYVMYQPRRLQCTDGDRVIPDDELKYFIENSIIKFETAIQLFKDFQSKKIDHVYYWDAK